MRQLISDEEMYIASMMCEMSPDEAKEFAGIPGAEIWFWKSSQPSLVAGINVDGAFFVHYSTFGDMDTVIGDLNNKFKEVIFEYKLARENYPAILSLTDLGFYCYSAGKMKVHFK